MSDDRESVVLANIEKYGCHIWHIMAEGGEPWFDYSVGLQKTTGAPEIIIIGLKQPLAKWIINEYKRLVQAGQRFKHAERASGFIEGFDVLFLEVERSYYSNYFGWNRWLYRGDDFEVLQLVWPTTKGVWPWQPEASDGFDRWQPILSTLPDLGLH